MLIYQSLIESQAEVYKDGLLIQQAVANKQTMTVIWLFRFQLAPPYGMNLSKIQDCPLLPMETVIISLVLTS